MNEEVMNKALAQARLNLDNYKTVTPERLHTQINTLTEALEFCSGTSYIDDAHRVADEALITKIPTS